jgi:hypothetical protein
MEGTYAHKCEVVGGDGARDSLPANIYQACDEDDADIRERAARRPKLCVNAVALNEMDTARHLLRLLCERLDCQVMARGRHLDARRVCDAKVTDSLEHDSAQTAAQVSKSIRRLDAEPHAERPKPQRGQLAVHGRLCTPDRLYGGVLLGARAAACRGRCLDFFEAVHARAVHGACMLGTHTPSARAAALATARAKDACVHPNCGSALDSDGVGGADRQTTTHRTPHAHEP